VQILNRGNEGSAKDQKSGQNQSDQDKRLATPPAISLPKGGGAIRGMGEKFAANPVTGTGSMSVAIATSPGRSGFGPQLALSYDSGGGAGPFGFGWNLSLPAITRKTDKGLPRYNDLEESDVFILSGAEDLVPVLVKQNGGWEQDYVQPRTVDTRTYRIKRYRPRIEGLFARIEFWTNEDDPQDCFWRSISKDNITTWYGRTPESRIFDPQQPTRVFSWLICESHDDKGNVISYRYQSEDGENVDLSLAHERNRGEKTDQSRSANRYLKRVFYGNRSPYLPKLLADEAWPEPADTEGNDRTDHWMFEVVFDYEEGHYTPRQSNADGYEIIEATANASKTWIVRNDPFSSYRAGFEIRTYRLCQRVLMFQHFPDEEIGADCLVRSTDFNYSYERNPTDPRNSIFSFLRSVTQSGYKRQGAAYLRRSLPPLEFEYTDANIDETVHEIDPESLENLPYGIDGGNYQWIDLDGEGLSGILTEQAEGWFYKRNLGPINLLKAHGIERSHAKFAPVELVGVKPNATITDGQAQFMDLAGDGRPDLVLLDSPTPGFYEHDEGAGWSAFRAFRARLNRSARDPNLKFIDLDGDGHADALITEDEAFTWHPSLGEDGFGPAKRATKPWDEEKGPAIVFADAAQSIYLADLSGDGLTDLVRIRNGEVCYWPNLGYGRFGAKVTMDNSPWFDTPEIFDQRRIRLADIDGSGLTDIIYLHGDEIRLYFNQSGNSWSDAQKLELLPQTDNLSSVTVVDLLGNGTACLVWSSPLPGAARRQMRYVDLMGGQKPHLLVKTKNNLGAETEIQYAPSTKFYLRDKFNGKPWVTRLPFPVHCVEKVTVIDKWRNSRFATTYSYHHGYFDGVEREFRGFGRVEQVDTEKFGTAAKRAAASPHLTEDKTLYQPPVKTITWFHTGAYLDRERILSHFKHEYFPTWFEKLRSGQTKVLREFEENDLPEPDLNALDLTTEEWREALRACKGMPLRQEVYELDAVAMEKDEQRPVKLFFSIYHNCHIERLQPMEANQHAVFLVTESEAITYNYELDLTGEDVTPDPRIAHTLNLRTDEFGHVLQSVAVVYPRAGRYVDQSLPAGAEDLIADVQTESHLVYTESIYTITIDENDDYRVCLPWEVKTFELTGIKTKDASDAATEDSRDDLYFSIDELRRLNLSEEYQPPESIDSNDIIDIGVIPYQQVPSRTKPELRLIEHARTLYFNEALTNALEPRQLNRLGIPYENYKLALTEGLIKDVFGDKLGPNGPDGPFARAKLDDSKISGYLSGAELAELFAAPGIGITQEYWMRSGVAGFNANAAQRFYLPERYVDPFGNLTTLRFDAEYHLFLKSSIDPMGNTVTVEDFDFRVLAPRELKDPNDNYSAVAFDILGMPIASAVMGKNAAESGDNLANLPAELTVGEVDAFFTQDYDVTIPRDKWLGNATARHVYDLGEKLEDGRITYGHRPAGVCAILREKHLNQLGGEELKIQVEVEYSDGLGAVLVKKAQAEPDPLDTNGDAPLRWIASGKTILNNKGKPVKKYEPYFSLTDHRFDEDEAANEVGVTPIMYYDAPGRLVRTELPDGSYSRVEFSPWHVSAYDQNDTAYDPSGDNHSEWYKRRTDPNHPRFADYDNAEDRRAADLVKAHANTPSQIFFDSLGREVVSVAHNKFAYSNGGATGDEKRVTLTRLDAEGKPLWIRDARGNLVMQYITPPRADNDPGNEPPYRIDPETGESVYSVPGYDIAGNPLFQRSMDAGDRWMLNDAAGKPMFAWDSRGAMLMSSYDALHRPLTLELKNADHTDWILVGLTQYGEGATDDKTNNRRSRPYRSFDQSGVVANQVFDFKGAALRVTRRLANDYDQDTDWRAVLQMPLDQEPDDLLTPETFTQITEYDALNRMTRQYNWHRAGNTAAVYEPTYNARGLLESENLTVGATQTQAIKKIWYNEKGQRLRIRFGNNVITDYAYDPDTFRLSTLVSTRPNKPILQNLSHTYDPVGNITEIFDAAIPTEFFNGAAIEARKRYVYDALYRLIEATGREHAGQINFGALDNWNDCPFRVDYGANNSTAWRNYIQRYTYDSVGNILVMNHIAVNDSANGWTRQYQYATDSNRLLSTGMGAAPANRYATAPTLDYRYGYNVHGSMTSMPHLPAMDWDYTEHLRYISRAPASQSNNPDGCPNSSIEAWYRYDASKQRTRKRVVKQGGIVEERFYIGGLEWYRRTRNGQLKEEIETLHLFDGEQRLLIVDQVIETDRAELGKRDIYRYTLSNNLGSSTVELDENADIISYEEYHPYGSTAYQSGRNAAEAKLKRYRYTGMERDDESGLNYHEARYAAFWLGRWVSCDPGGIQDGLNLFAYVGDNPIWATDKSGQFLVVIIVVGVVMIGLWVAVETLEASPAARNKRQIDTATTERGLDEALSGRGAAWEKTAEVYAPAAVAAAETGLLVVPGPSGDASALEETAITRATKQSSASEARAVRQEVRATETIANKPNQSGATAKPESSWQDFLGEARRRNNAVKEKYGGVDLQANLKPIPQRGTKQWATYASEAFQGTFAENRQLFSLWKRAAKNAGTWDEAREAFWALVRTDKSNEAKFVREMLDDAGFVFRKGSADGTAPVLSEHIGKFSEARARAWAGKDSFRNEIVDRLIAFRESGTVPASDFSDRVLSIDHVIARENGGPLLDPVNLRFMIQRDNSFKGTK
jgi:RHS repeat-associated protein